MFKPTGNHPWIDRDDITDRNTCDYLNAGARISGPELDSYTFDSIDPFNLDNQVHLCNESPELYRAAYIAAEGEARWEKLLAAYVELVERTGDRNTKGAWLMGLAPMPSDVQTQMKFVVIEMNERLKESSQRHLAGRPGWTIPCRKCKGYCCGGC